jgi:O-antigen ligase
MMCAFALLAERRPLARWAIGVVGLLLLVGLFMTGSRGGLVGMAVALVAAIILAGPARMTVVAAALVILGAGVAYYVALAPQAQVDRLLSARADRGTGREDIWTVALQVVRDKPLTGAGAGNFTVVAPSYAAGDINIQRVDFVVDQPKVVHNTYLEILAELGVVGTVLFGVVVIGALASAFAAIRRARICPWELQLQVRGFAVGLLGILSVYFFGSREYEKQLWLLLGIALALPLVVDRLASSRRAPEVGEQASSRPEQATLRSRYAEL